MRVLLSVDPELPVPPLLYGGIERIVDGLARELAVRGHIVGLIAHPESKCEVASFRAWPGSSSRGVVNSLRNTASLLQAARFFHPDILHSFSRLGYMLPLLPTRLPKIMSYQRHTGGSRNRIAAMLGGRRFVFTACSEFLASQGRRWGGRWEAIPNFVNTESYRFAPAVTHEAPLAFLGRMERIKGAHEAIAIARTARRKLILAGNIVKSGPDSDYFDHEIAPHIDGRNVEYLGPVNDTQKNELLGRCAALLMPIEWDEPFGIVMVEAMACGTPVVAYVRGSVPEVVRDGVTGYHARDVRDAANKVTKLKELSRATVRRECEERFSHHKVTATYEMLYRELVAPLTHE